MKKIVIFFFIILTGLFNSGLFSQTKIDSLKKEMQKISYQKGYIIDTTRFNLLNAIGNNYRYTLPDSAIFYHLKAKILAIEFDDKLKIAEVLKFIGSDNLEKANYELAISYYSQALLEMKNVVENKNLKLKALKLKSNILSSLGSIYLRQGRYPKALEFLFSALKINEQLDRKDGQAQNYNVIGSIYAKQRDYPKALNFLSQSAKIYGELKSEIESARVITNIGNIYGSVGNYNKALKCYFDALKIFEKNNIKFSIPRILANIGITYFDLNNYSKALEYNLKAKNLAEQIDDKSSINAAITFISFVYLEQKEFKLAEAYTKQALILSEELNLLEDIKTAHQNLFEIYQQTNRPALALESYKKFIIYRDSITNVENDKAIIHKELQYNYEKKATADSIINAKAQEIKDAQLAKNKLEIKAKQNQQYALFGGLALVLVFAGFMYNRFKITQRQKVIIEEQKKLVDISQKKTMDSINYAKKIQHSILPSSEALGAIFPNHFIFFKPKDVVSGDFYWFHHQDNLSFIAVADCTGHGVPGAFMTMIGYSNLIEVVAQQKVIEPNKILENLHQHIFNNLQQNKGDAYSQDGMDISLVVIDHENSLLHFSAAYNHGYLVHNKQIHTLKATLKSIGGLSILGEVEPERHFKAETIPFTKGSLLILTTDGIFDQLNKQDEKFGNERFKELALNFNSENAQENLQLVEQTYYNWKQDAQQLDDLCLLGIVI